MTRSLNLIGEGREDAFPLVCYLTIDPSSQTLSLEVMGGLQKPGSPNRKWTFVINEKPQEINHGPQPYEVLNLANGRFRFNQDQLIFEYLKGYGWWRVRLHQVRISRLAAGEGVQNLNCSSRRLVDY